LDAAHHGELHLARSLWLRDNFLFSNLIFWGATMRHASMLTAAILFVAGSATAGPLEDGTAAQKKGDYAIALEAFRPLAEQGNADAQLMVGVMFVKGQGVSADLNVAQNWFKRAAENPEASKETRTDATYNRDAISRKLKEWANADAAAAARQQAAEAAAARQLEASRAVEAAARASKELDDIRWENEKRKASLMEQADRDRREQHRQLDSYLERSRADQAQRDSNYYELRSRAQSRGGWNLHSR